MSDNGPSEVRRVAEAVHSRHVDSYSGVRFQEALLDINRAHSINFITDDFLEGYMQDGRMSVVRRFFCLFVTFDLVFITLLWLICVMVTGDSINEAFHKQVIHYTIQSSLFDVVLTSICRFMVLIFFYAILYINHWAIIALSTSSSCTFLICKVFVYHWVQSNEQVFEVVLIITSFVLAWGEAWFLDCRVIPRERNASRYFSAVTPSSDQAPLLAHFLASQSENPPESIANYYSPLGSAHNSDTEEEKNEEYHQIGLNCIRQNYALLVSSEWKVEKVTHEGDTISSINRDDYGKIYRLTGRIKYPARALLEELFYNIEDLPKWNPRILESKIINKINAYTDVSYQVSSGSGGGLVKSRDFVSVRCWKKCRDGVFVENNVNEENDIENNISYTVHSSCNGSVTTGESIERSRTNIGSVNSIGHETNVSTAFKTLSNSLGAKDFNALVDFTEPPPLDEEILGDQSVAEFNTLAPNSVDMTAIKRASKECIYITSGVSIDYPLPSSSNYIRGENLVSCCGCQEISENPSECIFELVLCLDMKGYVPRYLMESTYVTFLTEYMSNLRKHVKELRTLKKNLTKQNTISS